MRITITTLALSAILAASQAAREPLTAAGVIPMPGVDGRTPKSRPLFPVSRPSTNRPKLCVTLKGVPARSVVVMLPNMPPSAGETATAPARRSYMTVSCSALEALSSSMASLSFSNVPVTTWFTFNHGSTPPAGLSSTR